MDKFDRIFQLHQVVTGNRYPVSLRTICDRLQCSESTARRIIHQLGDLLGAPLEYDREYNGYQLNPERKSLHELPGLWFTPQEIHALLVSHQLLDDLQPGILTSYVQPIKHRIRKILAHTKAGSPNLHQRVRVIQLAARPTCVDDFRKITAALLDRKRIRVFYHGRERDQTTERVLSPQRLVYYRSNWYLDAWCHLRNGLRTFSLDRLRPVESLSTEAREIPAREHEQYFAQTYGIFAGEPTHIAHLRFTGSAARWVADEQWHPKQEGEVLADGGYELRIPYSDPRELVMDILRYGEDVEVLGPDSLRERVRAGLARALRQYQP